VQFATIVGEGDPYGKAGASAPIGAPRPGIADRFDGRERQERQSIEARAVMREAMTRSALMSAESARRSAWDATASS